MPSEPVNATHRHCRLTVTAFSCKGFLSSPTTGCCRLKIRIHADFCAGVQCSGWPAGGPPLWKENGEGTLPRGRRRECAFQLQLVPIYYTPICSKSQVCDCELSVPAGLVQPAGKKTTILKHYIQ